MKEIVLRAATSRASNFNNKCIIIRDNAFDKKLFAEVKTLLHTFVIGHCIVYVTDNIEVTKNVKSGISGGGGVIDLDDNVFILWINKNLETDLHVLNVVCHEAIHINQFLSGRLIINHDAFTAKFEGNEYSCIYNNEDIDPKQYPWENEAYYGQNHLLNLALCTHIDKHRAKELVLEWESYINDKNEEFV